VNARKLWALRRAVLAIRRDKQDIREGLEGKLK